MQIAVIGVGPRSEIALHIPAIDPGSRVTSAVDVSAAGRERATRLFGDDVALFASHADLIAAQGVVDAAVVCTPDHTHAQIAIDLLGAGIAVYLEKPMALTIADADAVLEAARESGSKLYVGHNMRHMAVVTLMRSIIERGEIGEVRSIWCRHFVGNGGDYYFKDWHAERRYTNTLLLQKGAHDIDVIHFLAGGYSESVSALGGLGVYGEVQSRRDNSDKTMPDWFSTDNWPPLAQTDLNPVIDVEDLSMMMMRLDNGVLASYQQCHYTPDYWRNFTVIGTAGRLENFGDGDGGVVRVWNRRQGWNPRGDLEYPIHGDAGGHGDADVITMTEFLRFVADGDPTTTSPIAARQAVAAASLAAVSLRSGMTPQLVPAPASALVDYFDGGQITAMDASAVAPEGGIGA